LWISISAVRHRQWQEPLIDLIIALFATCFNAATVLFAIDKLLRVRDNSPSAGLMFGSLHRSTPTHMLE
jgi:hypothetical protein